LRYDDSATLDGCSSSDSHSHDTTCVSRALVKGRAHVLLIGVAVNDGCQCRGLEAHGKRFIHVNQHWERGQSAASNAAMGHSTAGRCAQAATPPTAGVHHSPTDATTDSHAHTHTTMTNEI
jgi:hypothetical protein